MNAPSSGPIGEETRSTLTQPAASRPAFDFLQCATCRRDFHSSPPTPFFVTACAHALCESCLFPPPIVPPRTQEELSAITINCTHCYSVTQLVHLDATDGGEHMPEPLRTCLRPLRELLDEMGMAVDYQVCCMVW